MIKRTIIKVVILVALFLGFYRICCLAILNKGEDYLKYSLLSPEQLRFTINKDDFVLINQIKKRVKPNEGVLILHSEEYFLSYYIYPIKLYKYKKGYFGTSKIYNFRDVEKKWLEERNIKWVVRAAGDQSMYLKHISEMDK